MSYKKLTIRTIVKYIDQKKVYLPALQRKFVWGKHQIELLFDSLMRNYPFGSFLFWQLHRQTASNYVFYEFLTEYDERSPYNRRKTGPFLHEEIIGVLDGQQRLSSIYLGLMGTHTEKTPRKWSSSQDAYPTMALHLNLLSLPYFIDSGDRMQISEERNFEFRFLTPEVANSIGQRKVLREEGPVVEPAHWFKVGDVLSWEEEPEFDRIIEELKARTKADPSVFENNRRAIKRSLQTLHDRLYRDELVNYFEVVKDDLEDILKIFVRVNSGGTVLNKTDLLFSTIVATWEDGREHIERLLKSINAKGDGFSFGNEFLMRCCLVLSDGPVVYKVNSFKAENVERIKLEWPRIAQSISEMVDLLVEFGFTGETLASQNATIALAYYLYKGGSKDAESKEALRLYLIHALLNRIYGNSQDQVIIAMRNALRIRDQNDPRLFKGAFTKLTVKDILNIKLPQQKLLTVTEEDLDRFLAYQKGPSAFLVLTLLYPHLRYHEVSFHQDHIHPFSSFTDEKIGAIGIPREDFPDWYARRDSISNLQLLEGRRNESKNATPLAEWLNKMPVADRNEFAKQHYFPPGEPYDFSNFIEFTTKRRDIIRSRLRKVLAMTTTPPLENDFDLYDNYEDSVA